MNLNSEKKGKKVGMLSTYKAKAIRAEVELFMKCAFQWVGTPYVWGGDDPSGIDCCLAGNSLVSTPSGFCEIRDIKVGDKVLSYKDGKLISSSVSKVFENGTKPLLKIKTTASTLYATGKHKFLSVIQPENENHGWATRKGRKLDWKEASELMSGDIIVMARKITPETTVNYSMEQLRFFGAMIGDGYVTDKASMLCFVSDKKCKLVAEFRVYAEKGFGFKNNMGFNETSGMKFHCVSMRRQLIDMGFGGKSSERELPQWVYRLDNDQLSDFMYGYLCADGSRFDREEHGYTLSSASEKMIRNLHNLLLSRGYFIQNIKKTERTKKITIKGKLVKDAKTLWTISINDKDFRTFPVRDIGPDPYGDFSVSEEYTFHKINSVVDAHRKEETFDITVENSHSYIANGFVVHNSGLVQECLESIGRNPPGGDKTADGIYRAIKKYRMKDLPNKGSILFFGTEDRITHTAIAINRLYMIEAGGGGSRTTSEKAAWAHNAWVRVRPIASRKDLVAAFLL